MGKRRGRRRGKKRKIHEVEPETDVREPQPSEFKHFGGFKFIKFLNSRAQLSNTISVLGTFSDTRTADDRAAAGAKIVIICPATELHVERYGSCYGVQDTRLVVETCRHYKNIVLPYLSEKQLQVQWIYNILEKKAEVDRIVFDDQDEKTGFVMLPDMKSHRKGEGKFSLIAIVYRRDIRCLRDLDKSHLPLLTNIMKKGMNCIRDKFCVPHDMQNVFIHYPPTYYHLHIHFESAGPQEGTTKGSLMKRAHPLASVIRNIETWPSYYQDCVLPYPLRADDALLARFEEAEMTSDAKRRKLMP
ncbi:m7GpppX diphosphatase-like [Diadema antillarum]|uniref:m7GpppX diphosphatase-like n=1 Tax=Diadema antillarum TaxID=105358 RepID=UPI003A8A7D8F